MKFQSLGRTGLSVSRLSFGAMTFGTRHGIAPGVPNTTDEAAADAIIGAALDAGVNLFDTSNAYGLGESEEILGRVLGARRRDIVIATKVGFRMGPARIDTGLSYGHIMASAEASLRRLGTDYIDVFLLHRVDPTVPFEETARALDDLVRQGKVRYTGQCNHPAWQIERFLGIAQARNQRPMTVAQMYYSLLGRDIEQECVGLFKDTGMGTMIWSPLAGGFLTGKYRRGGSEGGRRDAFSMPPIDLELGYAVVDALEAIARAHDATIAQIALAWILARAWVTTVLVGASNIAQLHANLRAGDITLSPAQLATLDELTLQKARYPHPDWLAHNTDRDSARAAVGKSR